MDRSRDGDWLIGYRAHVAGSLQNYEKSKAEGNEWHRLQELAGLIEQGLRTAMTANPGALGNLDAARWAAIIAATL
jgi:hypothetical protein